MYNAATGEVCINVADLNPHLNSHSGILSLSLPTVDNGPVLHQDTRRYLEEHLDPEEVDLISDAVTRLVNKRLISAILASRI